MSNEGLAIPEPSTGVLSITFENFLEILQTSASTPTDQDISKKTLEKLSQARKDYKKLFRSVTGYPAALDILKNLTEDNSMARPASLRDSGYAIIPLIEPLVTQDGEQVPASDPYITKVLLDLGLLAEDGGLEKLKTNGIVAQSDTAQLPLKQIPGSAINLSFRPDSYNKLELKLPLEQVVQFVGGIPKE
jgi:hypothetical protein